MRLQVYKNKELIHKCILLSFTFYMGKDSYPSKKRLLNTSLRIFQ